MERYKEGPYFLNFLEIWPFLIPFHTFPIRSIVMEIQSFFPSESLAGIGQKILELRLEK